MSEGEDPINALKTLLKTKERWYLWVIEYGITHSLMRLALHDGTFPRHHRLECEGCVYLKGKLQGGPYVLEVDIAELDGNSLVELKSVDRNLRLVCERLKIVGRTD